jgi:hypothetical protein
MVPLMGLAELRCNQCGLQMPPPEGYAGEPVKCPFLASAESVAEGQSQPTK